jgi:membrane-associated phospholipid phosphatase
MKTSGKTLVLSFLLIINTICDAQVNNYILERKNPNPFTNILTNTGDCFTGKNSIFHTASIVSTYLIIQSNTDYEVNKYFSENQNLRVVSDPAAWVGYILPAALCGSIYSIGKLKNDNELTYAGCAAIQATLLSVAYSSLLKAFTGRPNPDPTVYTDMKKASRTFRFGLLRGGIHYGWPSGHLAVNTAMVTSLMYFYKDSFLIDLFGYLYIGYLIFGVSSHEGSTMHWFSDVVAGTLIGYAIGSTVGSNFRNLSLQNERENNSNKISITPVTFSDYTCLTVKIPL